MPRVAFDELVRFGERYLVRRGMSRQDARFISTMATITEAAGVSTHGIVLLLRLDELLGASVDPAAKPVVVRDKGAIALLDCEGCAGPVALRRAMEMAKRKARKYGIAMVAVRNGTWIAGLGSYCLALAKEGFFVQLWAQSNGCLDSAPYGGIDARFSTNPVGLGFPTAGEPMVADFSTAVMSMGKVGQLIKKGLRAPEPVFFDKNGNLTDDPRVMREGGAMFLMGGTINGYKGYAFALWAEALTAMAGGSCNNPKVKQRQCFNLTLSL
ncbi:MAG: Ldh family oxidoreductase, partial [Kiritimatiellae bacterium]|nr:Ldh family oxidoreductase [Kiritimatiellia bacterium]